MLFVNVLMKPARGLSTHYLKEQTLTENEGKYYSRVFKQKGKHGRSREGFEWRIL